MSGVVFNVLTNTISEDGTIYQASVSDIAVRKQRDDLLLSSDWTQVADALVDKTLWAEYRQALRDIPSQEGFPENVIWPTKPV